MKDLKVFIIGALAASVGMYVGDQLRRASASKEITAVAKCYRTAKRFMDYAEGCENLRQQATVRNMANNLMDLAKAIENSKVDIDTAIAELDSHVTYLKNLS